MEYPAAIYHVLHRSDQRKNIFRTNAGLELFLETLSGTCCKIDLAPLDQPALFKY